MSQSFATAFYKSPAWRKNRRNYLRSVLDTSGNVLVPELRGGRMVYHCRDDNIPVPDSMVVPPGVCERCFAMGRLTPAKVVHHKQHLTPQNIDDPKVSLAYDNLQRLCQDCHAAVHSDGDAPRVWFDEHGQMHAVGESFEERVLRLTETVDERRNFYTGGRN